MAFSDTVSKWQQKAAEAKKAITSFATAAATIVALLVPDYSDDASWVVGLVIALLGTFATYQVKNKPQTEPASGPSA